MNEVDNDGLDFNGILTLTKKDWRCSTMLSDLLETGNCRIIDLTLPLKNGLKYRTAPKIVYKNHRQGAEEFRKCWDISEKSLLEYAASETITLCSHSGSHMDAPWHYGSTSEGKPARTIDQIPLEWCYGNGVLLDFTHRKKGEIISRGDVIEALKRIDYALKPRDIVLIRTDCSQYYEEAEYQYMHPGMSREATLWLVEQGIKVMGTDAWGWDASLDILVMEFKKGKTNTLWAPHYAGKEQEYCHMEKLCNLDKIYKPHGFLVFAFPMKIENASGGWVRAVAIVEA
jgi:kynurenine formamidase